MCVRVLYIKYGPLHNLIVVKSTAIGKRSPLCNGDESCSDRVLYGTGP